MIASLRTCFGCSVALRDAAASSDGFCSDCMERSRETSGDDVGGEA